MAEALSSDNQDLLRLIAERNPQSLAELEQMSGRKKSNLSRTLKRISRSSSGLTSVNLASLLGAASCDRARARCEVRTRMAIQES